MKVLIKEFNVDIEIKNRGVELEVRDPDNTHRGDLILTRRHVIWCTGRTLRENGKRLPWNRFIEMMDAL